MSSATPLQSSSTPLQISSCGLPGRRRRVSTYSWCSCRSPCCRGRGPSDWRRGAARCRRPDRRPGRPAPPPPDRRGRTGRYRKSSCTSTQLPSQVAAHSAGRVALGADRGADDAALAGAGVIAGVGQRPPVGPRVDEIGAGRRHDRRRLAGGRLHRAHASSSRAVPSGRRRTCRRRRPRTVRRCSTPG